MAIVSSTKKIASRGLVKSLELKVNCSFQTEDKAIDKVLDAFATAVIDSNEKVGDFLQFAGRVNLTSLFVDQTKQLQCENFVANFGEKVQVGDVDAISLVPKIEAVKQRKETSNYVDCMVTILVEIYGVWQETISFVEPNNSSLVERKKELECDTMLCFNNTNFNLTEEVEVGGGNSTVLTSYSNIFVSKVTPNGNYANIEFEVVRDIIYRDEDLVKRVQKRSEHSQEVALLNCTDDTILSAKLYLSEETYNVMYNDENTKGVAMFSTTINVSLWGFEKTKFMTLEDVYSTTKELEVKHSAFSINSHLGEVFVGDTINENVNMSDKKRIDEIVFMGSNSVTVENSAIQEDMLCIKGVISQKIIAKNYDNDDMFATEVNVPFNSSIRINEEWCGNDVCPKVNAKCTSFKNKAGRELNLTFELGAMCDISCLNVENYISSCEELEEKHLADHSIIIYMPKENESVYEISKKLNVSPDVMLAQNPGMSDGSIPKKIVMFRNVK